MDKLQKQQLSKQISDGFEVEHTVNTDGFKILETRLRDKLEEIEHRIKTSSNPNEVFSCIKEKNGLVFILESAQEIVLDGRNAADALGTVEEK